MEDENIVKVMELSEMLETCQFSLFWVGIHLLNNALLSSSGTERLSMLLNAKVQHLKIYYLANHVVCFLVSSFRSDKNLGQSRGIFG